ncbi:uncharacterized protein LOC132572059 [Heteronotia binoei]|uniref:uncharacterized protein LOC132572059 n=1 Tax=Heteronotia binoei TaxID=13085 RepID=UPI00292FC70B|nr:uncharacterized protein LOC132572059 [Heteronotia binoei]
MYLDINDLTMGAAGQLTQPTARLVTRTHPQIPTTTTIEKHKLLGSHKSPVMLMPVLPTSTPVPPAKNPKPNDPAAPEDIKRTLHFKHSRQTERPTPTAKRLNASQSSPPGANEPGLAAAAGPASPARPCYSLGSCALIQRPPALQPDASQSATPGAREASNAAAAAEPAGPVRPASSHGYGTLAQRSQACRPNASPSAPPG